MKILIPVILFAVPATQVWADPQFTSWLTMYSGQYARIYTTSVNRFSVFSSAPCRRLTNDARLCRTLARL